MGKKDKIITINPKTSEVFFDSGVLGIDGENLQGNLVFQFSDENFIEGTARLEIEINGVKSYAMLTRVNNTYILPIKSFLTKQGKVLLQFVLVEGTNLEETPILKSSTFFLIVKSSINAEIEQEEGYNDWITEASARLNAVDEALTNIIELTFQIQNGDLIVTYGGENNG